MNKRIRQYAKIFRQTNKPAYFSKLFGRMQKEKLSLEELEWANYILLVNKRAFCAWFRAKRERIEIDMTILVPPDLSDVEITTSMV